MNTYTIYYNIIPNLAFQRVLTGIWGRRRFGEEKDESHIHKAAPTDSSRDIVSDASLRVIPVSHQINSNSYGFSI